MLFIYLKLISLIYLFISIYFEYSVDVIFIKFKFFKFVSVSKLYDKFLHFLSVFCVLNMPVVDHAACLFVCPIDFFTVSLKFVNFGYIPQLIVYMCSA
jgi:hypothetical protein